MRKNISVQIISLIVLLSSCNIFAQEKFIVTAGIGFPEYLNVGVHYQLSQLQFGIKYGAWPTKNIMSISSDISLHFGSASELSEIYNWFMLIGLNYWRNESEIKIENYTYISFRFGRNINISRKFGINFSLGILGEINQNDVYKINRKNEPYGGVDIPLLLGGGLEFYYRI